MSSELSGVRSSWLMFARNSLLYVDASDNWCARSSSSCLACSISRFLVSMSWFWRTSRVAFSSSSALERCSSSCCCCNSSERACSSTASRCDSLSSSSVRALATIVLRLTPIVSMSWSRKARCTGVNACTEASSITPSTCSSTTMGSTITDVGSVRPSPEEIVM